MKQKKYFRLYDPIEYQNADQRRADNIAAVEHRKRNPHSIPRRQFAITERLYVRKLNILDGRSETYEPIFYIEYTFNVRQALIFEESDLEALEIYTFSKKDIGRLEREEVYADDSTLWV